MISQVVEGALDLAAALLVAGPSDRGLEAIVLGEGEEGGVPAGFAPDPAERDGGLVVIGGAAAEAPVIEEGRLVSPEQGREPFVAENFRVVCARYRQRSTLVVSNLPFKQWAEFLPSPAQAVAIADRLVDDATILRFSGKPYRQPRDVHGAPLEDE